MKYPVIIASIILSPLGYANCLGSVDEYVTSTTLVASHTVKTQVTGQLLEREQNIENTVLNTERDVVHVQNQDEACFYDKATQSLVLNYAVDVYTLSDSHKQVLQQYLDMVDANAKIYIEGHADSLGSDSYNKALSARRAKQVTQYLQSDLKQGNRIVEHAYGEKAPICQVAENKATGCNRRVVITVQS
ncbi:OmpA family protein [Vibrio sp. JPW-9-11-11]|uniref:OmpA family protein n=1 Tax=Vibrio sp. JPW-9-11-11 TaxID=1416532 RepID=UPI001594D3B4|nr:OmpA family protein [Vibrio sp. JPW-9-11-11]NVD07831.1 OmpA family protein [Vibrio sp. JPW-9-11-11]